MTAMLEAALGYAERGIPVFPVKPKGKEPLTTHGFTDATTDKKTIRGWWKKWPKANIGLHPGGASLVVVDIDGPEGMEFAQEHGVFDDSTPQVITAKGCHVYFAKTSEEVIGNAEPHSEIDIRSDKGYVIAPPSIHPSGLKYIWENEELEFAPLPEGMLRAIVDRKASTPLKGGKIPEGQRNNRLLSFGGGLWRRGITEEGLLAVLSALNGSECDPPLPAREVARIAAYLARRERAPIGDIVERINSEFAHLLNGGRSLILRTLKDGTWDTLGWADFRRLIATLPKVPIGGGKFKAAADYWLTHPDRLAYDGGIVFEPGEIRTKDAFNLFRGWAYEPREGGRCDVVLEHIRENVCRGDAEMADWVLSWFAHIFQFPDRKAGTALALRGRQGTGKSIVGAIFGKLMGAHYQTASSARYLTGNFNAHLEETLLFQLEEAFWAGDKNAEGVLKDLITGKVHLRERKYQDPVLVDNLIRVFVTSNESRLVPAGPLERRFTVLDIGEGRLQDDDYFAAMVHQLEEEDGYSALLHFALNYAINEAAIRKPIRTDALSEQIAQGLSPKDEWLNDILNEGVLPGDVEGKGSCLASVLYDDHVKKTGYTGRRRSGTTSFGMWLHGKVPGLGKDRVSAKDSKVRTPFYVFPPLKECREAFDAQATWPEPYEWQEWVEEF